MGFYIYIASISMTFFFLGCHGEDQVKMTMLSFNHFKSEEDTFYQCQMSDPDNDPHEVTVQSLRTGWTRNTAEENPDPPEARYTDSDHPFYVVDMFNNGTNNSFGVFGCNATKDGQKETIISTIRMRSDAVIVPTNDLFTQTVSINDRNVSIKMMSTSNEVSVHMLRWRKNTFFWGQPHFGVNSFTIDGPVQLYHAGIYECHVAGDRFLAKHGLNLLIVRACPSTKWGPPDCEGVCESCYNGGICDENTGNCVCAPGFRGENCLEACGGYRYGYACEHRCSYKRSDSKSKCEGILFCLIHPYGCRCNTGFRGLDCETECEEGTYGASCLESCHCASGACSRYTGACEGVDTSCDPGWTGEFCQECVEGYFGTACDQKCHCLSDKCNRESGLCQTGGCLPQWADLFPPYSCQTGLESANYTRGNPNVAVQVNCTVVQGPGGDLTGFDVVLSRCNDDLDVINITLNETFRTQTKVTGIFTVRDLDQGADLYCQLREKSNARVVAVLAVNVELYALPALSSAPTEVIVTNSSVTIQWPSWDENTDVGDPPIVGYIPYYRKQGDDIWIPESYVPIGDQLQFTFNNLDLDTYYLFSVSAVREGEGGEGSRSPPFEVKTLCATPSNGPKDVVTSIAGERQELVEISWKHPPHGDIRCRGGVIQFNIYYSLTSLLSNDESLVVVNDSTATSYIIANLEVGEVYDIEMTLTTEGGESIRSNQTEHLIPVLPEISTSPNFMYGNSTSITISWTAWNESLHNGTPPVVSYKLYHKLSNDSEWNDAIPYYVIEGQDEYLATVKDLHQDSLYDFCVAAVRDGIGGEGPRSPALKEQKTIVCKVPPSPEKVVANVVGERQQLVEISWELPSEVINCSSGVTKFKVYYYSSETEKSSQDVTDPTVTSMILFNLTAGVSYTIFVTVSTSGGESEGSHKVDHLVPVIPSFANPPSFSRVTCSSVTVIWPRWTVLKDLGTPPIVQYIPYYRESSSVNWTSGGIVTDSETEDEYQFTFHDLTADSIYEFCVVVVREGVGGEGDKVKIRRQNTAYCSETSLSVTTYVVAASIVIPAVLTFVAAVFCSLRCRKGGTETSATNEQTEGYYENTGFEDLGDYAAIGLDYLCNQGRGHPNEDMKTFSGATSTDSMAEGEDNVYEIPAV